MLPLLFFGGWGGEGGKGIGNGETKHTRMHNVCIRVYACVHMYMYMYVYMQFWVWGEGGGAFTVTCMHKMYFMALCFGGEVFTLN